MTALLDALSDAMLTALALPLVTVSMAVPVVVALVILAGVSIRPGRLRLARRRLSREWRMTRRVYRRYLVHYRRLSRARHALRRAWRPGRLARLTWRP